MSADQTRADADYQRARLRAAFRNILARLSGQKNELLSFEEVKQSLRLGGPIYRGTQPVPLAQIVGSVDRYRDFDRAFMPAQNHTAGKWKSIARAFYDDVGLPPIKLYKVGDAYFVLDGHHRVSVARDQGAEYIDAEVQEAYSRVSVTADLRAEDLKILHEYREFLERTQLDAVRPQARPVRLTIAGGYYQLLEHIAVHRHFMGNDLQRYVSEEEAVGHWYDTVYLPVVEAIRAHDILEGFPHRTEADLYLWIVDRLYHLRTIHGDLDADAEDAIQDLTDEAGRHRRRAAGEVWQAIESRRERDDQSNSDAGQ